MEFNQFFISLAENITGSLHIEIIKFFSFYPIPHIRSCFFLSPITSDDNIKASNELSFYFNWASTNYYAINSKLFEQSMTVLVVPLV